jgi:hypothetical protein
VPGVRCLLAERLPRARRLLAEVLGLVLDPLGGVAELVLRVVQDSHDWLLSSGVDGSC